MLFQITFKTLLHAQAEILLSIAIVLSILLGVFSSPQKAFQRVYKFSIGALLLILCFVLRMSTDTQVILNGFYITDAFCIFSKIFILVLTIFILAVAKIHLHEVGLVIFELPILIMFSTLGMMFLCSANDFLTVFVAIELMSLSLYVLIALNKKSIAATEASLKYFILGALATGMMLYGISWIYGFSGSTNFEILEQFLFNKQPQNVFYIAVGFILLFSGFAFKLAAVPFHNWAPDVYEGTPLPILTYLITVPKYTIFALMLRLVAGPFNALIAKGRLFFILIAILSMLVGSIATITQRSLKRFITYSGIAQVGFALTGMSVATEQGYHNTIIFLIFYVLSLLGFMACLLHVSCRGVVIQKISDLNGLGKYHPIVASCLCFFTLSIAGIPPFPGFIPKLLILESVVHTENYILAIVAVIYSIIAAAYYLLLVKAIFFEANLNENKNLCDLKTDWIDLAYIIVLILILLGISIFPNPFFSSTNRVISMLVYFK